MSRTTLKLATAPGDAQSVQRLPLKGLISSSNDELVMKEGYSLAVVDEQGNLIQIGDCVLVEVFNAMKTQVVKQVFSASRPMNDEDFC